MPNISMHTEGQASSFTCESYDDFISQHSWNSASQMFPKDRNCEPIFLLIHSAVSMEEMWGNNAYRIGALETTCSFTTLPSFFFFKGGGINLSKVSMTAVPHPPSSSHLVQCNFSFLKLKLALRRNIFYGNNKLHMPVSKHRSSKNTTNVMINGLMPSRNNGTTSSRITWNIG